MTRLLLLALVGCGHPASATEDAGVDAPLPADPFAGMFDDPSEFPRARCPAGALADFAHAEIWTDLGLRTTSDPLETFLATWPHDEVAAAHVHTADDLLVRRAVFTGEFWALRAINICDVEPDGTVRAELVDCDERLLQFPELDPCVGPISITAAPFRRIPGESEGEHLRLLGETGASWPGASSNVRIDGDLAFVSRFADGLRIVSIADPTAPVEVGHIVLPGNEYANDLKLVSAFGRRYAIVASVTANIIDVTDPVSPQLVAQLPFAPHSVFVEGTRAYLVTGGSGRLQIWDVAIPHVAAKLGDWMHPDPEVAWHDVFVANGIAYLSDIAGSGLHVVDVRDPENPIVLGAEPDPQDAMWHSPWLTTVSGRQIAIDGTEFSTPGMRLLDGDPASPAFLSRLGEWSLVRGSAHNLMAIGSLVYLAHYRDGVRVVDIADPASPTMIGYFNTWPLGNGAASAGDMGAFGIDLDPARKRIYVADSVRGFVILQGDTTVFP